MNADADDPNNAAIIQRDWRLITNTLRRLLASTILVVEQEIDLSPEALYTTADGLEKLAQASLYCCNLDIAALTLEARVARDGKGY